MSEIKIQIRYTTTSWNQKGNKKLEKLAMDQNINYSKRSLAEQSSRLAMDVKTYNITFVSKGVFILDFFFSCRRNQV